MKPTFSSRKRVSNIQGRFFEEGLTWNNETFSSLLRTRERKEGYDSMGKKSLEKFDHEQIDRIIEMAWEDRTPFQAIAYQFELTEEEVIRLMRSNLKKSSWKRWRKRVTNRPTKHLKKRNFSLGRMRCSSQKDISFNRYK